MLRADSVPDRPTSGARSRATRLLIRPSLGWSLVVYATLVLAIGWAYSGLRIRTDLDETLQAERARLHTLTTALQTQMQSMVNEGVETAVAGAREVESVGALSEVNDSVLSSTLSKSLAARKYVRSVFLAGPARFARSGRGGGYESSGSPPSWFTALPLSGATESWVGRPIADPDDPAAEVIPVARHLQLGERGIWAGVLVNFQGYESLQDRTGKSATALALLAAPGAVLVRMTGLIPGPGSREGNIGSPTLFEHLKASADSGVIEGFAPALSARMLFSYARLSGYPLAMVAGRPIESVIAPWKDRTRTTLWVVAAASLLLVMLTWILAHYVRVLFRRETHYRALFNNAAFSAMLLEGSRFVDANETVARMFGLKDHHAAIGMTPWELSPDLQPDGRRSELAARDRIDEALHRSGTTFEWTHKRLDTGETFPAEVDLTSLTAGGTTLALAVVHDLTERKRAERELKESEHRYRALVDALPEAVFVHRGDELLFVNSAGLRFLGAASAEALAGRAALSFVIEEDREIFAMRTRGVLEQGAVNEPRETRLRRLDGSLLWVEMQCLRISYGGAPAVQGVFYDVTARKRREAADAARADRTRKQSEALLRIASRDGSGGSELGTTLRAVCAGSADVLGVDRVGIWLLDDASHTLRCMELHERGLPKGRERVALPANRFSGYLETLRNQRVIEAQQLAGDPRLREIAQGQLMVPAARSMIAAAIRVSGELAGVVSFEQVETSRVWQADEVNFASAVADQIAQALLDSQREQALGDLRVLAGELMRSQDEERRRIGRDLHDSTGQTLVALELDLSRLEDRLRSLPAEQRELLAECLRLASQCSAEIRTASYLLHPPLLDELGLVSALRWLADGLRSRGGIEVQLDLPNSIARLRPEEELTLFRIAQEALANAQRHSDSPWVSLRLTTTPLAIRLEVEDGGRGIAPADESRIGGATPPLGVGLTGMRERIRQVGGTFSFESTGSGTRICATMAIHPWPQQRSA